MAGGKNQGKGEVKKGVGRQTVLAAGIVVVVIVVGFLIWNFRSQQIETGGRQLPTPVDFNLTFRKSDYDQLITFVQSTPEKSITATDRTSGQNYRFKIVDDGSAELTIPLAPGGSVNDPPEITNLLIVRDTNLDTLPDIHRRINDTQAFRDSAFATGFVRIQGSGNEPSVGPRWNDGINFLINFYLYRINR